MSWKQIVAEDIFAFMSGFHGSKIWDEIIWVANPHIIVLSAYAVLATFYIVFLVTSGSNVAFQAKLLAYPRAVWRFLFGHCKAGAKPVDPSVVLAAVGHGAACSRYRVLFIRHGESVWNEMFNRGFGPLLGLGFLLRVLRGVYIELQLLGTPESVFVDSPLSMEGLSQSRGLLAAMETNVWPSLASRSTSSAPNSDGQSSASDGPNVYVFVSPLRRAVSTVLVGLSGLLLRMPNLKVNLLSCLAENTRNVDGVSLTLTSSKRKSNKGKDDGLKEDKAEQGRQWPPVPSPSLFDETDQRLASGALFDRLRWEAPICSSTKFGKFEDFIRTLSEKVSPLAPAQGANSRDPIILVGGHSLWFREFFKAYLPASVQHECQKRKVSNGGVVSFDLVHVPSVGAAIDPKSLTLSYGRFT